MSRGFCYLAERHSAGLALSGLLSSFQRIGLTLPNPWNDVISELNDEGDQVAITDVQLADSLRRRAAVTFQLWFSDDTDLICSFRNLGNGVYVHAYGLDGLDKREQQVLVDWSVRRFRDMAHDGCAVILVVDTSAATESYDWDAFVQLQIDLPRALPEVMGVGAAIADAIRSELTPYELETLNGYSLFFGEGIRELWHLHAEEPRNFG